MMEIFFENSLRLFSRELSFVKKHSIQKQPPEAFLEISQKLTGKTPVLDSLFLIKLQACIFPHSD